MMSGIRSTETKQEVAIRSGLHRRGFRFRKNVRGMPGSPDIVLPKYRAVVFVNGCFWHGHTCSLFKWPSTRRKFWKEKILKNQARDLRAVSTLSENGWRVLIVWECTLKGTDRRPVDDLVTDISGWIKGSEAFSVIEGQTGEG